MTVKARLHWKRFGVLACALTIAGATGCGDDDAPTEDAGTEVDSGSDAMDSGLDAGEEEPDAGEEDPDAGEIDPDGGGTDAGPPPEPVLEAFAIRDGTELVRIEVDSADGVSETVIGDVAGLEVGETIVGLDLRPASDFELLYALTDAGRLLTVDPTDASSAEINAAVATLPDGRRIGMDFNPAANALRIVADDGTNLRVPTALDVPALVDGAFGYHQSGTATAYSNARPGATGTMMWVLDVTNNRLMLQDPPNDGPQTSRGSLVAAGAITGANGYDILALGDTNEHWAILSVGDVLGMYRITPGADADATNVAERRFEITPTAGSVIVGLTVLEDPRALTAAGNRIAVLLERVGEGASATNALRFLLFSTTGGTNTDFGRRPLVTAEGAIRDLVGMDTRTTSLVAEVLDHTYAVGADGTIYDLGDLSEQVTSTLPTTPPNTVSGSLTVTEVATLSTLPDGTSFGVDFNPRADLLRVVSDTGQNLRINLQEGRELETMARAAGFAFVDGDQKSLSAPRPQPVATAYRAAPSTPPGPRFAAGNFQFILDARDSSLGAVLVPNAGLIRRVGPLFSEGPALPTNGAGAAAQSLDIVGEGDAHAIAAMQREGETTSSLYRIDLTTGAATLLSELEAPIEAMAVRVIPE